MHYHVAYYLDADGTFLAREPEYFRTAMDAEQAAAWRLRMRWGSVLADHSYIPFPEVAHSYTILAYIPTGGPSYV